MSLRIDRFTWIVIIVVLALLVAAVVTVSRRGQAPAAPLEYRTADAPETPIYNAFIAMQRGDISTAREQYSKRILDELKRSNYDPFSGRGYVDQQNARRLRIVDTQIDPNNPDNAVVTIVVDSYYPGGLFGGGNTSSQRRAIQVVREDGKWKIDTDEYFY
ncbi:MAG TPA: hypothetical protein PKE45_24055 [Caldilineaceae bacterium]|nr:hypothetical protein [Caldilineaceae bacterium]